MTKRQYKRECARQRAVIRLMEDEIADLCRVRDMAVRHQEESIAELGRLRQELSGLSTVAWQAAWWRRHYVELAQVVMGLAVPRSALSAISTAHFPSRG